MLDEEGYRSIHFRDAVGRLIGEPTSIPGLFYFRNIVHPGLLENVTEFLDTTDDWFSVGTSKNSRQVAHYGFKYNYVSGDVSEKAPDFPECFRDLQEVIRWTGVVPDTTPLDQCLVNRYLSGQGINAHTDTTKYGDYICCFTFGSGAEMEFTRDGFDPVTLFTEPGSLYIMSGESRYKWKHEMRARKSDLIDGARHQRGIRTSVTFRSVK